MGCCTNGRGCLTRKADSESATSCSSGCNKLDVHNWLSDLPEAPNSTDWVEVRFKNTRKAFFQNVNGLKLEKGDVVAVESSPGHDIGVVSLTGNLVLKQIQKVGGLRNEEPKKIYRKAKPADIEKWEMAIAREKEVMLETRQICKDLGLDMKVSDVEFQGDNTKAIFYYIAQSRVDFRELIKVLAERFRIRVEMRQIGARQEAGLVGGIGTCGRELCCSTWVTKFVTVTTSAARYQELSLNPQKLAGQCGKLKCCLNYELDSYMDAQKDFPNTTVVLETELGQAYHFKTDIFNAVLYYSASPDNPVNLTAVPVERVKEIIRLNKQGVRPKSLYDEEMLAKPKETKVDFNNVIDEDDLDRFDQKKDNRRKKKRRKPAARNGEAQNETSDTEPRENRSEGTEDNVSEDRRPNRDRQQRKPHRNLRTDSAPQHGQANGEPENKPAEQEHRKPRRNNRGPRRPNRNRRPDSQNDSQNSNNQE